LRSNDNATSGRDSVLRMTVHRFVMVRIDARQIAQDQ